MDRFAARPGRGRRGRRHHPGPHPGRGRTSGWPRRERRTGIDTVFLVAPSSTDERIALTAEACRGFVYAASIDGGHRRPRAASARQRPDAGAPRPRAPPTCRSPSALASPRGAGRRGRRLRRRRDRRLRLRPVPARRRRRTVRRFDRRAPWPPTWPPAFDVRNTASRRSEPRPIRGAGQGSRAARGRGAPPTSARAAGPLRRPGSGRGGGPCRRHRGLRQPDGRRQQCTASGWRHRASGRHRRSATRLPR